MEERKFFQIPESVYERDGPFHEFKQDASVISVELANGQTIDGLLVLYPNYIARVRDHESLPFEVSSIVRAFQTERDMEIRKCADWYEIAHPWDGHGSTET